MTRLTWNQFKWRRKIAGLFLTYLNIRNESEKLKGHNDLFMNSKKM